MTQTRCRRELCSDVENWKEALEEWLPALACATRVVLRASQPWALLRHLSSLPPLQE